MLWALLADAVGLHVRARHLWTVGYGGLVAPRGLSVGGPRCTGPARRPHPATMPQDSCAGPATFAVLYCIELYAVHK